MTETMTLSITTQSRGIASRAGAHRLSDRGVRLCDATPAHPADIHHGFPGARELDDQLLGARELDDQLVGARELVDDHGGDQLPGARGLVDHGLPGARELEMVWQMSEEPEEADTV